MEIVMGKVIFDRCAYEGEPSKANVEIECDTPMEAQAIADEIANDPRGIVINIRIEET